AEGRHAGWGRGRRRRRGRRWGQLPLDDDAADHRRTILAQKRDTQDGARWLDVVKHQRHAGVFAPGLVVHVVVSGYLHAIDVDIKITVFSNEPRINLAEVQRNSQAV